MRAHLHGREVVDVEGGVAGLARAHEQSDVVAPGHEGPLEQGLEISAAVIRERFLEAYRIEEAADREDGWVTSEQRESRRWQSQV